MNIHQYSISTYQLWIQMLDWNRSRHSHRSWGAAKAWRTPVPVPRCVVKEVPHGMMTRYDVPAHRCAAQRDVFCPDASELSMQSCRAVVEICGLLGARQGRLSISCPQRMRPKKFAVHCLPWQSNGNQMAIKWQKWSEKLNRCSTCNG